MKYSIIKNLVLHTPKKNITFSVGNTKEFEDCLNDGLRFLDDIDPTKIMIYLVNTLGDCTDLTILFDKYNPKLFCADINYLTEFEIAYNAIRKLLDPNCSKLSISLDDFIIIGKIGAHKISTKSIDDFLDDLANITFVKTIYENDEFVLYQSEAKEYTVLNKYSGVKYEILRVRDFNNRSADMLLIFKWDNPNYTDQKIVDWFFGETAFEDFIAGKEKRPVIIEQIFDSIKRSEH